MSEFGSYLEALRAKLDVNPNRADEICAEVRTHLNARAKQLEKIGLSREDAVAEAIRNFGDGERMAAELRTANSRHRSFGAFRALGTLALVWGTTVVVAGDGDFWDRTLMQPLSLNLHLSASQAMWVVLVILVSPAALLAGMLAGRRHWWVPAAAPTFLLLVFTCIISWAEWLTGTWEQLIEVLIPLSAAVVLGGAAFLGSRLTVGKRSAYSVGAVAAAYLVGISAAGLASLLNAVGILASIAVAEAGMATLALAALWDRYRWRSWMFWVGSVALLAFVVVMIAAGRCPARQLGFSTGEDLWIAILATETVVWVPFIALCARSLRRQALLGGSVPR